MTDNNITSERPSGRTLSVLVADDDAILRELIAARLAHLNADAIEAEDGQIAWDLLGEHNFDLAIVDLNMPNLDGISLIQAMRAHPKTRHLPIIVVTSRRDSETIAQAFAAGASSFLVKPIFWSTFEHHIGFLLRLAQDAGRARVIGLKEHAHAKAKETILGGLCLEGSAMASNMIADIDEMTTLCQDGGDVASMMRVLTRMRREASLLHTTSRSAATVVQAVCDNISVANQQVAVNDIISAAIADVSNIAGQANVHINAQVGIKTTRLACDPAAVSLALIQLLRNAVSNSEAGSTVTVTTQMFADGVLVFEVTDQGCGMTPDMVARYLTPLRTSLDTIYSSGKIGFGLPMVKAIADAHGGTLELRSMPREGTTALLVMPSWRVFIGRNRGAAAA